jgi:hypothetical protein
VPVAVTVVSSLAAMGGPTLLVACGEVLFPENQSGAAEAYVESIRQYEPFLK